MSKHDCLSTLVEIRSNSLYLANRSVKTHLLVVLNTNIRFQSIMFVIRSISMELGKMCAKSPSLLDLNTICSFKRMRDVQMSKHACLSILIEILLNSFDLVNRNVKTRLFVVLNSNLRFLSIMFVIRSKSMELGKKCDKSPSLVDLNTICSFKRMRDVQMSKHACLSILVEILSNSLDLVNRSVKTRLFVVLNTNLRLETTMFVISSLSMEFDK